MRISFLLSLCVLALVVTLQAQTNLVATTAAGMSPNSWAVVTQDSSFVDAIQCGDGIPSAGAQCAESVNRIGFALNGAYDWNTQRLHYVGQDHGERGGLKKPQGAFPGTIAGTPNGSGWTVTNIAPDVTTQGAVPDTNCIGATFDIGVSSGAYTVATNNQGQGCLAPVFTIYGTNLNGGSSPANDLTFSGYVIDDSYVYYDLPTNHWTHYCGQGYRSIYQVCASIGSHGYQHSTVNFFNGSFYLKAPGIQGSPFRMDLFELPLGGNNVWTTHSFAPVYEGKDATVMWTGPKLPNQTIEGEWIENVCELPNGGLLYWSPLTSAFSISYPVNNQTSGTECASAYSRVKNVMAFGGGDVANGKLMWRLNGDASVTQMCDSPVRFGIQSYNLVEEPNSGNFLLMGGGNIYQFDPAAPGGTCLVSGVSTAGTGTYTLVNSSVPSQLGDPAISDALISAAIPNYGVVMYIGCPGSGRPFHGSCAVYLYAPPTPLLTDFTTRCAKTGVFLCQGFESDADMQPVLGGVSFTGAVGGPTTGSWNGTYRPHGLIQRIGSPGNGDYSYHSRDTTQKTSGNSSYKMVIPADFNASVPDPNCCNPGQFYSNYMDNLSLQFAGNTDHYVQWRQMFDSNWINNNWAAGEGMKTFALSVGDPDINTRVDMCQPNEVVVFNSGNHGFLQTYNSCTGSSSHPAYYPFSYAFTGVYGSDTALQTARGTPNCSYNSVVLGAGPNNCFRLSANTWQTFEIGIHLGPLGSGLMATTAGAATGSSSQTNVPADSCSVGPCGGSGATWNITESGGVYLVARNGVGSGYTADDVLKILGTHLGGATPANDLTISTRSTFGIAGLPPNDEFVNSWVDQWQGTDGGFLEPVSMFGPYNLSTFAAAGLGKLFVMGQDTGRLGFDAKPAATVWTDEIIGSTNFIGAPIASGATPPPPTLNGVGGRRIGRRP